MRSIAKACFGLFLLGAVGGSLVDALHTHVGVSSYPGHAPGDTPWWWVVPELGLGALAYGLVRTRLWSGPPPALGLPREIPLFFTLLMFAGWALCALGLPVLTTCMLLLPGLALCTLVLDRSWAGMLWAVCAGIAGAGAEVLLVRAGLFSYSRPDVMGVPLWLPLVHSGLAVCAGSLASHWRLPLSSL